LSKGATPGHAPPRQSVRRRLLHALAVGAGAIVVRPVFATPEELAAVMRTRFAERPITPGRVKLEVPRLAENGYIVPITISVDSPMTEQDHVRSLHVFAESNPLPEVVDIELGPWSGRARVSTRMRVAISQRLHAVAVMSDDSLWSTAVEIEVTVGGCAP
jgi:sulfur-oxidizing protein SoxY